MTTDQEQKLNELHTAIVGNPALGNKGIVARLQDVEKYQETDKAFKYKVAGGMAVGTPILVVAWHWLKGKIMGEN
jgi:hypothetical protein